MKKQAKKPRFIVYSSFVIFLILISPTIISVEANAKHSDNTILLTYSFEQPKINQMNKNGVIYDQVTIPHTSFIGDPNKPTLPVKGAYILLPPKTTMTSIKASYSDQKSLGEGFNIPINPNQIPILKNGLTASYSLKQDEFTCESQYPGQLFSEIGTYNFRGYTILVLSLFPIQYTPTSGELVYYPEITISVETVKDESLNKLYRGFEKDRSAVKSKIDNPSMIKTYTDILDTQIVSEGYDLLILTSRDLASGFESLQKFHNARGIKTKIKTIHDVGSNNTEILRAFLRDEYMNYGIEYLLLGGDHDTVPTKLLYAIDCDIPSDLYYSCLDGPYNYDGDDHWGEPTDGEGGGDVDLFAEIYFGRACVDNLEEVGFFVNKTITYLTLDQNDEYLRHIVMAGEYMFPPDVLTFDGPSQGGAYMEELINESYANEYYTLGIPYDDYNLEKLYDTTWNNSDQHGEGWDKLELINRINNGTHIINHLGHSSPGTNMKLTISTVESFTNQEYVFIYSQGCDAGAFTVSDCIAEYFTAKTPHGAFAGIWNSHVGMCDEYSTNGPSQRYHRHFWDAVYLEDIHVISKANQDSKEDNIFAINWDFMRLVYYELNLFGDPTINFFVFDTRNTNPDKPMQPLGDTSGGTNIEYTYTTATIDPDDDQVLYLWDWGDGNFSDWLGPYNSNVTVEAFHSWTTDGEYEIRVKAKDVHGDESNWSEPLGVIMPKNNLKFTNHFLQILNEYFEWMLSRWKKTY